jgi:hypothetical protein
MTGFDLPANYHSDPESLIRKSRSSLPSQGSSRSPMPHEPALMATRRCINDFSAPSNANVRTGLEMNIRDGNFELKPALINVV